MSFDGFLFIDTETTGLEEREGHILELGMANVSRDLQVQSIFHKLVLDPYIQTFIDNDWKEDDFAYKLHDQKTGLLADIFSLDPLNTDNHPGVVAAEGIVWMFHQGCDMTEKVPYTGSSVHFDMKWVTHHMKTLSEMFGYRTIDASSFREWAKVRDRETYDAIMKDAMANGEHRVMPDILDSIELFRTMVKHGVIA